MGKEIRTFQLAFDEKQINVLVAGLHKLPGNLCMPLLGSIQEQIAKQAQLNNNHRNNNHPKKNNTSRG